MRAGGDLVIEDSVRWYPVAKDKSRNSRQLNISDNDMKGTNSVKSNYR
jgi:hypothetical protein